MTPAAEGHLGQGAFRHLAPPRLQHPRCTPGIFPVEEVRGRTATILRLTPPLHPESFRRLPGHRRAPASRGTGTLLRRLHSSVLRWFQATSTGGSGSHAPGALPGRRFWAGVRTEGAASGKAICTPLAGATVYAAPVQWVRSRHGVSMGTGRAAQHLRIPPPTAEFSAPPRTSPCRPPDGSGPPAGFAVRSAHSPLVVRRFHVVQHHTHPLLLPALTVRLRHPEVVLVPARVGGERGLEVGHDARLQGRLVALHLQQGAAAVPDLLGDLLLAADRVDRHQRPSTPAGGVPPGWQ
jgi:hypothetical protein